MNLWNSVHVCDVASLFRLALEKGPAGSYWHAVEDGGTPFRDIAEAIGSHLGPPAMSIPLDELMVPGYFGFLASAAERAHSRQLEQRVRDAHPKIGGLLLALSE